MASLEPDSQCIAAAGHSFDVNSLDEIVFVGVIARCPYDSCSHRLRSRLGTKFDGPFSILVVLDVDLFLSALVVSGNVSEFSSQVRGAFATARTVKEIETLYVSLLVPQDRVTFAGVRDARLLFLLFNFVVARLFLSSQYSDIRRVKAGGDHCDGQEDD